MARGMISLRPARPDSWYGWMRLIRFAILVGVLISSGLVAILMSETQMPLLLMLFAGIAGALVLIKWPGFGIIVILFGGVFVPDVGPKNINLPIVMVALLFFLWVMDMVVVQKKVRIVPSRVYLPLILFLVISFIAFGFGQFSWFRFTQNAPMDAQLGGLGVFVLSVLALIVVANQIKDLRWLQAITWTFIAIGSLYVILRATPGLTFIVSALFRSNSIGGIFWAWFPTLAFSQMLINRDLHPGLRVFLGVAVVASLYVGVGQNYGWKSGWVPQLVGIGTVVMLFSRRWGIFLALLSAYPAWLVVAEALVTDDYSVSTRLEAWILLKEIVKVNPLFGLGFANYYWYTPLFPIRGFAVRFNSHNNFVDIIAQTGLIGLGCFLWFLAEVGALGMRLRERVPEGFARAYVYGAVGGLVATAAAAMLGDWLLSFVYNVGLSGVRTGILAWIFLGGLVVLENLYRQGEKAIEPIA
jgi:hypothetical protein